MTGIRDWVPVIPGEGETKAVAILLLALADDPRDVRTGGNASEFLVAPYVAERFTRPVADPFATEPDPAPPRRTRTKKGAQ